jgi:Tfp pilus assembly protein PilO
VKHLAWWLRRHARELAFTSGALLLAAALLVHALVVAPLVQQAQALSAAPKPARAAEIERLRADVARPDAAAQQLAAFQAHFRSGAPLTERLRHLHDTARRHGLTLQRADYRLEHAPQQPLARYQVVLPLHGSYPAIRDFIATLLREQPTLALEQVQFQRRAIGEGATDALLTLTYFLPS